MTLQLIARNVSGCDEFLSDIVTSNVVVAYDGIRGALEVGVSTSNASYNQNKNDFEISIETKKILLTMKIFITGTRQSPRTFAINEFLDLGREELGFKANNNQFTLSLKVDRSFAFYSSDRNE